MAQEHRGGQLADGTAIHALVADEILGQQVFDVARIAHVDGGLHGLHLLAHGLLGIVLDACAQPQAGGHGQAGRDALEPAELLHCGIAPV